jgi:hypothetical protein
MGKNHVLVAISNLVPSITQSFGHHSPSIDF